MRTLPIVFVGAWALLMGCESGSSPRPHASESAKSGHSASADDSRSSEFEKQILLIAANYKRSYMRVSDRAHWSPQLCRAPLPTGVQQSASNDPGTHGRKLYFLYAANAAAYDEMSYGSGNTAWKGNPVGQAVVKEAFRPEEVLASQRPEPLKTPQGGSTLPDRYLEEKGTLYRAGDPAGLFIMLKLDPATPRTDHGWIYAVTTPDAAAVLEVGAIKSCMDCHTATTRDRLYGHRASWPPAEAAANTPAPR